jgi:hypothetical protein
MRVIVLYCLMAMYGFVIPTDGHEIYIVVLTDGHVNFIVILTDGHV